MTANIQIYVKKKKLNLITIKSTITQKCDTSLITLVYKFTSHSKCYICTQIICAVQSVTLLGRGRELTE